MIVLQRAIGDYRAIGKTPFHAIADNFRFEKRLSGARRTAYEGHPAPAGDDSWEGHHVAYVKARINRSDTTPDTFTAINADAHLAEIEDNQTIVRLEEIDWVLKEQAVDLGAFAGWFQDAKGTDAKAADAREALDLFVEEWNGLRDNRPIFAGFEGDVRDDLDAADWPHRLRDRWGLAHYDPLPGGAPINVVLVSYKVGEVRRGVAKAQRTQPLFAYPTALDGPLNPWFFPAPAALPFGRTLDLQPDGNCERHVAEILHRRIDYKPSHLAKLGVISAGRPAYSLKTRRNDHLYCLQYHSERDDFGQAIPDHVVD